MLTVPTEFRKCYLKLNCDNCDNDVSPSRRPIHRFLLEEEVESRCQVRRRTEHGDYVPFDPEAFASRRRQANLRRIETASAFRPADFSDSEENNNQVEPDFFTPPEGEGNGRPTTPLPQAAAPEWDLDDNWAPQQPAPLLQGEQEQREGTARPTTPLPQAVASEGDWGDNWAPPHAMFEHMLREDNMREPEEVRDDLRWEYNRLEEQREEIEGLQMELNTLPSASKWETLRYRLEDYNRRLNAYNARLQQLLDNERRRLEQDELHFLETMGLRGEQEQGERTGSLTTSLPGAEPQGDSDDDLFNFQ